MIDQYTKKTKKQSTSRRPNQSSVRIGKEKGHTQQTRRREKETGQAKANKRETWSVLENSCPGSMSKNEDILNGKCDKRSRG
jgi:hypothetical protein